MWEFWIDVGGTFTDCLGRAPDGALHIGKVLSSSVTKGAGRWERLSDDSLVLIDPARTRDPGDFWVGVNCTIIDSHGKERGTKPVTRFDSTTGTFHFAAPWTLPDSACSYELHAPEEAPLLAMRWLMRIPFLQPMPSVMVKLGTTRGTNALLTRRGARTAFVTTRGFADVLRIANQDRPRLFDLTIRKPEPLPETVVEIDERLDANGTMITPMDDSQVRDQLMALRQTGIESLAVCLMHSFTNSTHELRVEQLAREVGFREISRSSRVAPLIKIVSRGETTVVDAYLNPILRDSLQRLRQSMPESSLKLMTSAGGLVSAEQFTGKDSLLSGPAGGVIGYAAVVKAAGVFDEAHSPRAIGFDMGGTSTDVSRFDGRCELEFETLKAGVRIVSPMLAIETVAAGGGSLCGFDGVRLFVGPQSAGANPGPACYGNGGPLTITDINLFLGKIPPARFPFPLHTEIVREKLEALCAEIARSALQRIYTPAQLAEGFLEIANALMARAIRKISVAKGYNPADYVLIPFGGAGGQHACGLARGLGMRRILLHPLAGVLSAYGMGQAQVRRFAQRAVLRIWSEETQTVLAAIFPELEQSARDEVLREGVPPEAFLSPERSLDVRYRGIETTLNIPEPADGDYRRAYNERHRQFYGYERADRELEVVAARVEVVGQLARSELPAIPHAEADLLPVAHTETWFAGRWHSTPIYQRDDLRAGHQLDGPAIVCEPTATVVIDPGFHAEILARGELLITGESHGRRSAGLDATMSDATMSIDTTNVDPVRLEIFHNQFASIAEQMGITLQQTAVSTNVKERLDFSCALFTATGGLVVNAPHIPVHLGAMSETVRHIIADNPRMEPGEVFVTNDPYRGGSHLPDVTVVTPVHDPATSQLLFFTASRAHHAEIGGIVPGSMPPFSRHLGEEGVLIRNFKLVSRGETREAALRDLLTAGLYPTRNVADNLADVRAQVAANQRGARQLLDLVQQESWPVVETTMRQILEASARKMRIALQRFAGKTFQRTDFLDDGSPIAVTITIREDHATVDFTGTGPVLASNLNANRAIVTAAVMYVFRCLIDEDIPLNSGVMEPVTIVLPECLLNPPAADDPAHCAAMVGGNVETSQRVVDVLLGALELAAASQGTMNNLTFGNKSFGYYETICGGSGATADGPGADAVHTHMTNTRLTDPEVLERRYPVRLRRFAIRHGSGGAGRNRGGDGIVRELEFLQPLKVSLLTERRGRFAPFGLNGGAAGTCGDNHLHQAATGATINLGGKASFEVQPGDVLTIATPGGGGYGAPAARGESQQHHKEV